MFDTLPAQIFAVAALAVCGFAFFKGGPGERAFASAYVLGWFASLVAQLQSGGAFLWALLGIDSVLLLVFGALSWKYRSPWLFWAVALQGLTVVCHVMNRLVVTPTQNAFYTILNITSYGILIALAVGAFWAWQERRAAGLE